VSQSLEDLRVVIRSNHWQTDPLSGDNPFNAICSRGDLVPDQGGTPWVNRSAVGCIDAKAVGADLQASAQDMRVDAISGPTTSDGAQPPFDWTEDNNFFANIRREGQPQRWDFPWTRFKFVE
jgi:hypothetical protein